MAVELQAAISSHVIETTSAKGVMALVAECSYMAADAMLKAREA
jgi:hypothetical protein